LIPSSFFTFTFKKQVILGEWDFPLGWDKLKKQLLGGEAA